MNKHQSDGVRKPKIKVTNKNSNYKEKSSAKKVILKIQDQDLSLQ